MIIKASRLLAGLLLSALVSAISAQNEPVSQLRNQLLANGATYAIKIAGLHATSDVFGRPMEMRIVNGTVVRGAGAFVHGSQDYTVAPGQMAHVTAVTATTESKRDALKLQLVLSQGLRIPVTFVLPQGSLASMSEPQLLNLINGVLTPLDRSSYGGPATPTATASSDKGISTTPPTQAPAAPAAIRSGLIGSKTFYPQSADLVAAPALPAFSKWCTSAGGRVIMKTDQIVGSTVIEQARENIIVDGSLQPMPFMSGRLRQINIHPGELDQFVEVRAITDGEHDVLLLVVRTSLPVFANVAFVFPKGTLQTTTETQMRNLVEPWMDFPGASRSVPQVGVKPQQSTQRLPVSCPAAKSGAVLDIVTVRLMPSGKELEPTQGDDIGIDWDLPAFDGAEYANLECGYAKKGVSRGGRAVQANGVTVRIPAGAKACHVTHDPERAFCAVK